jgi:hypothetical protein
MLQVYRQRDSYMQITLIISPAGLSSLRANPIAYGQSIKAVDNNCKKELQMRNDRLKTSPEKQESYELRTLVMLNGRIPRLTENSIINLRP